MMSTASGAGHTLGIEWAALCQRMVRIEELVKLQRRLLECGLAVRSDEDASARRRYKYFIGPSAIASSILRKSKEVNVCWRDVDSHKEQVKLMLRALTTSLSTLRKECWVARQEARLRLSLYQYWALVRKIRKSSKIVRTKEQLRLAKKEKWIRRKLHKSHLVQVDGETL